MADELVLARLSVDPSGVVSGVNITEAGIKRMQNSFGKLTPTFDAVTKRMFSFRTALLSIARAFGVVGIVTGLAFALKNLVTDLISSTTWFQNAAAAVTDWWNALVKGETALDRLVRKVGGGGTLDIVAKQTKLLEQRKKLMDEMRGTVTTFSLPGAFGGFVLPFSTEPAKGSALDVAKTRLKEIDMELVEVNKQINDATSGMTAFREEAKRAADHIHQFLSIMQAGQGLPQFATTGPQDLPEMPAEMFGFQQQNVPPGLTPEGALRATDFLESIGPPTEGLLSLAEAFEAVGIGAQHMAFAMDQIAKGKSIEDITEQIQFQQSVLEAFSIASSAFANAVASAFFDAGVGMKKAMASMLRDMARIFLVRSIESLATGILASTPYGQAMGLGNPSPYFAAAKLFGGLAALAGGAARAIGGGGEARSHGGGGAIGASGSAGGDRIQNVNLTVHGFVGDEDALARQVAKMLRTAASDGARI